MFEADLGGALLESARTHRERPAFWAGGERVGYGPLFDRGAGIAAALSEAGVAVGERVAVLARRDANAYSAIIGALLAGCTYVPLNTRFPRERNQKMLTASGAAAVVVDAYCAARFEDYLDRCPDDLVVIQTETASWPRDLGGRPATVVAGEGPRFWAKAHRTAPRDQPAYLLFTSGTTGAPKGVPISHDNVDAYLGGISRVGGLKQDDRVLQLVDLTFDLSVHDMFLTWLSGAELYVVPENASLLAPRLIRQHQLTACLMVPSAAAGAIQQNQAKPGSMPSLRLSYFCGEALPRSVAQGWAEAAPNSRVINIYGPTEATVAFSRYEFASAEAAEFAVLPIGRPLGEQRMELFEPDMTPPEPGAPGQICLGGTQLTAGYWRAPEIDAEKFAVVGGERWYLTGDLGRWIEPYGYIFDGRADRQVKIRGYRAELQEIEGVVRRVTGRQQVAVIPWPLTSPGVAEGSVAFICGKSVDGAEIRAACRQLVADYLTPDQIIFVDELPLNANGKVDYKVLAQHSVLAA